MPALAPKSDFPILLRSVGGQPLSYLDNAATTQKPRAVLDAERRFYERHNANVHRGVHTLAEEATARYEQAREQVARLIGARERRSVVFTAGSTAAINLVAQGWGPRNLRAGDALLLTEMEHHSNLVPWQMLARQSGADLRYLPVDSGGLLRLEALDELLTERTRLVAVTHTSNVLGTVNPLASLIERAHRVGALVLVDAAQAVSRTPVDVAALDCDFLVFSGHKMLGPTGIGVLYGKPALLEAMEPAQGGGGMIRRVTRQGAEWAEPPWKFEAGTPNIAGAVGLGAAVEYLLGLGLERVAAHEAALAAQALRGLEDVAQLRLYGPPQAPPRAGVLAFNLDGLHPHDVCQVLDTVGVAVRGGHHCCQVLMERLAVPAVVRASLAPYNDEEDVERLLAGLRHVHRVLGHG